MIRLENISKDFVVDGKTVHAVKDVTIEIDKGQIFGIIGFSGAGKSTLVRCINLLERPTSGKVFLEDTELTALPYKKLREARHKIGMIFQSFNLMPSRTVYENIELPLKHNGYPKDKRKQRIEELLSLVELSDKGNNYPSQLSGGEQQRVSIARALAKNPELLLCDEPTGALDYNTGKSILKLLQDTSRKKKMTVIVITHNLAIAPMADRVIKIKNGKVDNIITNENPMPVENIEW